MTAARAILGRLVLACAGGVLALVLLEVICRIAVPHWQWLVPQRFMTTTPAGVLAGVPNFRGRIASLFRDFDVSLTLDARGFRNPPDADPAAPLAFIGDSFCLGWGVRREESVSELVARRLGVPYYSYCTVGADLLDEVQILRTWMPPRAGRTTVLTITFENDVHAYPRDVTGTTEETAAARGFSRRAWSIWLMEHSAAFDVAMTLARQSATIVALVHRLGLVSGVPIVTSGGTDPIEATVRMTSRIREAAGGDRFVVLVVPPRPGQVEFVDYGAFVGALTKAGFDVVDPRAVPGLTITTIPRDGHWDAATHAAIASVLAAHLEAGAPGRMGVDGNAVNEPRWFQRHRPRSREVRPVRPGAPERRRRSSRVRRRA